MFGLSDEEKIKKEIEKKAGNYKFGYNMPKGLKDKVKKSAEEMNKYYGKDIINIDEDD
jgi:hypothetical protein